MLTDLTGQEIEYTTLNKASLRGYKYVVIDRQRALHQHQPGTPAVNIIIAYKTPLSTLSQADYNKELCVNRHTTIVVQVTPAVKKLAKNADAPTLGASPKTRWMPARIKQYHPSEISFSTVAQAKEYIKRNILRPKKKTVVEVHYLVRLEKGEKSPRRKPAPRSYTAKKYTPKKHKYKVR